jgi:uncharacterized membrane protein
MRARLTVILVLALVGAAIAGYLTVLHYTTTVPLICVGQGGLINCADVLSSPQSVVLGLPVAAWGLAWFVLLALGAWVGRRDGRLMPWLTGWALAGAVVVVYLVYVEFDVLHAVCIWCSTLHLIILVITGLAVWPAAAGDAADQHGSDVA